MAPLIGSRGHLGVRLLDGQCGPKPMLIHVHGALQQIGVPQERIDFEFFGPREEFESASVA